MIARKTSGGRSLASAKAARGVNGSRYVSFPLRQFEEAVLELLAEVKVSDVLPATGADDAQERVALWSGKVSELEHKVATTRERIDRERDIAIYLDVLADLERQKREAVAEFERAKQESASGAAEAIGEVKSLVKLLGSAEPDERKALRSRLRARIAEVVAEAWCLIASATRAGSRGRPYRARVACIQLHFHGNPDRHRVYVIETNLRTGRWSALSIDSDALKRLAHEAGPRDRRHTADLKLAQQLDLRRPEHAAAMERLIDESNLTPADEEEKPTKATKPKRRARP